MRSYDVQHVATASFDDIEVCISPGRAGSIRAAPLRPLQPRSVLCRVLISVSSLSARSMGIDAPLCSFPLLSLEVPTEVTLPPQSQRTHFSVSTECGSVDFGSQDHVRLRSLHKLLLLFQSAAIRNVPGAARSRVIPPPSVPHERLADHYLGCVASTAASRAAVDDVMRRALIDSPQLPLSLSNV